MPPELIVVPDCTAPASNSSVPPLSTVVLLTVPPDTAKVTPLLTVKPDMAANEERGAGQQIGGSGDAATEYVKRAAARNRGADGPAARAHDFGAATVDRRAGGVAPQTSCTPPFSIVVPVAAP